MNKVLYNEKEICSDYKSGLNISRLISKYGGRRETIRKILFQNDLIDSIEPIRKCYFNGEGSDDIINRLLQRYVNEKNLRILSDEFNIPVMSIYNFLKKEKVYNSEYGRQLHHTKIRKYELNEQFFDVINTEEHAYFLGILYADGCNSLDKGEITLRLQENDLEILKRLNIVIGHSKPIGFIPKKSEKHKNLRRLTINSKKMSNRLNDLGMMQNKTFKLEYPKWMPENLHNHFIRGYFDGDGCVTFNKINKQLSISFTGTENMMIGIQDILIRRLSFSKTKLSIRHPERNHNIRSLSYFGNGNSIKFYDFIYDDATIFMRRKKNKFNEYL